jgi:putative phosphonate metabolism protein
MMHARYALYFAPDRDTPLWDLGCRWLGRDPERDTPLPQPAVPEWDPARLAALTAAARGYGLHATLKPPFVLRAGVDADALHSRLASFCRAHAGFDLPALSVARLSRFVALRPAAASAPLQALADACVVEFDDLRTPLREEDASRRRAAELDPRQEALLEQYGYPYVLDQYRFHLTLTEPMDTPGADRLAAWLADFFAPALCQPIHVSGICLFVQREPGADFRLARRFAFAR